MVKTAVAWNKDRAKIQWKFLSPRQRRSIKWNIFWAAAWMLCLVWDVFFPPAHYFFLGREFWIAADVVLTYLAGAWAWHEYSDILSPQLLTQDELTEGTE